MNRTEFRVVSMCRVLSVSRAGFYAWRRRDPSRRSRENACLTERIRAVHAASRKTYGSPRVYAELRESGVACGRHRVARLMRRAKIQAQRMIRYRRSSATAHGRDAAANLVNRRFAVPEPNRVWAGDMTYLWTGGGWLYLAVVIDLASRRVVGWAMSAQMTDQLTRDALSMALGRRRPRQGLVHHSDQGSQYGSAAFRHLLTENGVLGSMSRRGDCYDNAVVESFFKTLKIEMVRESRFVDRAHARAAIFDYIEVFYNRRRRHSTLGYLSPEAFEKQRFALS